MATRRRRVAARGPSRGGVRVAAVPNALRRLAHDLPPASCQGPAAARTPEGPSDRRRRRSPRCPRRSRPVRAPEPAAHGAQAPAHPPTLRTRGPIDALYPRPRRRVSPSSPPTREVLGDVGTLVERLGAHARSVRTASVVCEARGPLGARLQLSASSSGLQRHGACACACAGRPERVRSRARSE